ncbi:MAG TPA: hypothetical protein VEJ00_12800, partial [Candidatus Acidoferrales bacterium]|nr:hypothetical protein [Candidatus Acidoferrales bacterium]
MEIVFYIGLVLFVLFGPWILLWRVNVRRKNERLEDQLRWADLTGRIHALERELRDLRAGASSAAQPAQEPAAELARAVPPPVPDKPPAAPSTPVQSPAEAWGTRKPEIPFPTQPATAPPAPNRAPPTPAAPPDPRIPAPVPSPNFAAVEIEPSLLDRFRSTLDIEEMLGTNWLNKIGIALVVLGVAFFLQLALKSMGPAGKV